jgi:hypothetical protein
MEDQNCCSCSFMEEDAVGLVDVSMMK